MIKPAETSANGLASQRKCRSLCLPLIRHRFILLVHPPCGGELGQAFPVKMMKLPRTGVNNDSARKMLEMPMESAQLTQAALAAPSSLNFDAESAL